MNTVSDVFDEIEKINGKYVSLEFRKRLNKSRPHIVVQVNKELKELENELEKLLALELKV